MNEKQPDVRIVRTLPAPRRRVFEAWLNADALRQFMCPAEGSHVSKVEVDPRVGGSFLVMMNVGGEDRPHRGEYRAIEPHERLEFTWRSAHAGERSHVVLNFRDAARGHTELTLEHFGLPAEPAPTQHLGGWTHIVGMLEKHPFGD